MTRPETSVNQIQSKAVYWIKELFILKILIPQLAKIHILYLFFCFILIQFFINKLSDQSQIGNKKLFEAPTYWKHQLSNFAAPALISHELNSIIV